jgi:hypothetical protein
MYTIPFSFLVGDTLCFSERASIKICSDRLFPAFTGKPTRSLVSSSDNFIWEASLRLDINKFIRISFDTIIYNYSQTWLSILGLARVNLSSSVSLRSYQNTLIILHAVLFLWIWAEVVLIKAMPR